MDIREGDSVEYKCSSARGVSPWLECCVASITEEGYDLGDAVRSEEKRFVNRASLRFVRRASMQRRASRLKRLGSRVAGSCTVM